MTIENEKVEKKDKINDEGIKSERVKLYNIERTVKNCTTKINNILSDKPDYFQLLPVLDSDPRSLLLLVHYEDLSKESLS